MNRETMLLKIAGVHGALLGVVVTGLALSGYASRDVLLGGLLMAAAYGLLWGIVRSLVVRRRRGTVTALATVKVGLYGALIAFLLQGSFRIDPFAFAGGMTCFLVAVVATVVTASRSGKLQLT